MIALHGLIFIIACLVLVISGTLLIKALPKIASYLKISGFVIGFILIALSTSAPELFIGITSALNRTPILSLGDVLGSNIINLTLVIGLVAIFARGIQVKGKVVKRDLFYTFIITLLPLFLMLDRQLSRLDGIVLLLVFLFYLISLLSQKRNRVENALKISRKEFFKNCFLFSIGIILLLISAQAIVHFGSLLALELGLPLILIGIAIVALGTSLPELTFQINAVIAKREEMALGDLLGSVSANSALVLGIVAIICPIDITDFSLFLVVAGFLIIALILFTILVRTKEKLTWKEGMILIFLYIIFIFVEFSVK